jgi:hypothetical protein
VYIENNEDACVFGTRNLQYPVHAFKTSFYKGDGEGRSNITSIPSRHREKCNKSGPKKKERQSRQPSKRQTSKYIYKPTKVDTPNLTTQSERMPVV